MLGRMGKSGELEVAGGSAIVTLRGELDAHDAPRLREMFAGALERASAAGGHPRLVLDLRAVDFLDSSALGAMVGALRRTREAGGELAVVLPEGQARRIFEITGLEGVLDVRETREEALTGARLPAD